MRHLGFFSGIVVALLLVASMILMYSEKQGGSNQVLLVQDAPRAAGERGAGRGGAPGARGGADRGGADRGGAERGADRAAERGGDRGAMGAFMGGPLGATLARTPGQAQFGEFIDVLAELNLEPDFNLTQAQKENIKQVRDGLKAATEKWRSEQEPELQKLVEQARQSGTNRDAWRELGEKRQAIMATAPSAEAAMEQIRQLLTAEQLKALEEAAAARRAETEERRRQAEERLRGGRGGAPGGGAPGGGAPGGGGGRGAGGGGAGGAGGGAAPAQ
jgi:Spy/CpxP family protein refolding chaperone